MKGFTVWFTGLSGSGKSTIANALAKKLRDDNLPVVVLDGNNIRENISSDLGFSLRDRERHLIRVAYIAKLISENQIIVLVPVISPTKNIRKKIKNILKENMLNLYIKCPMHFCELRDPRGLYKQYKSGKIKQIIGKDINFEEPKDSDMIINTHIDPFYSSVDKLYKKIKESI